MAILDIKTIYKLTKQLIMSIELTPAAIEAYKEAVSNPSKHNLKMRLFAECLQKSETITASHILFDAYHKNENHKVPKVIFYMLLEDIYGQAQGKDGDGYAGYFLSFKPKEI
jgi:hypothetical protein